MINLPNVTLCTISNANIELTKRALEISQQDCVFGDVLFWTNKQIDGKFRLEKFPDVDNKGDYITKNVSKFIKTSHVLFVQYDGYVISPHLWNKVFLDYDYIGAKWPWYKDGMTVGNSGFCLRSRYLLDILAGLPTSNEQPEDG